MTLDFSCASCSATLSVDSPTYEDLLVNGCLLCEKPVSPTEFRRAELA